MLSLLNIRRAVALLILVCFPLQSQLTGNLKIAFIRISFEKGNYPGFTGTGDFNYSENNFCGQYTIDPTPHDFNYFNSHIHAVNNYFRNVSFGKFGIDIMNSTIFPINDQSSYKISRPMNYYNELGKKNEHEYRITQLLKDAVLAAFNTDGIDLSGFDVIAIIHPGLGQDFNLPFLDPTPEDIPSTFVDKNMVNKHLGGPIQIGNSIIESGIIIPESQNFPLMDPSLQSLLDEPCDIQYSITGTWAMMIGFAVGLPPLWDINTGQSGVGVFSLMDQGSNNGRGIIPAPPDAWTRIYAGWELPNDDVNLNSITLESGKEGHIYKKQFSKNEYFLIENRNNWYRDKVSIDSARYYVWENTGDYPSFIKILIDSTDVVKNQYGVITQVPNYNLGLPGSGLLIWHIDEEKIKEGIDSFSINDERENRGIDLEEADGAQDIGYISNLLTDPSSGYWGDMWFAENQEYFRANSKGSMTFSSYTFPNSKSKLGANSGLIISDIPKANKSMTINLSSNYDIILIDDMKKSIRFQWDVDRDGDLDFVGGGDVLWWSDDLINFKKISKINRKLIDLIVAKDDKNTHLISLVELEKNCIIEWFEFNPKTKSFYSSWKKIINSKESISLVNADGKNYKVNIQISENYFSVNELGLNQLEKNNFPFSTSNNEAILHLKDRIVINESIFHIGQYRNISLIDLENDGIAEILAVDLEGNIYAFDNNLYLKNGFPVTAGADSELLALDLLGDKFPELIFQNKYGGIQIINYKGDIIEHIASNSQLMGIGVYNGKNAMIINNKLILFNSYKASNDGKTFQQNEWRYPFSTPDNSRELLVGQKIENKPFIMDFDNTYAYPNPSTNQNIIFRIAFGNAESIDINIFDIAGYLVTSFAVDISSHNYHSDLNSIQIKEAHWNVNTIDPGVYIARVIARNGKKSDEKIIKVGLMK